MSKWPWPQRLTRITRSSPACFAASASSNTTRSACAGSGAGMIPSAAREADRGVEGRGLADRPRLDQALLDQRAEARRVAVVAQAAGVHGRRDEVVAQRVHRHQRRQPDGVAEVVAVDAAGQRRAGGRLGGDEARRPAPRAGAARMQRVGDPGEVRAAADAADDHVRVLARQLELLRSPPGRSPSGGGRRG